jgi:molecular chaperone GrpE
MASDPTETAAPEDGAPGGPSTATSAADPAVDNGTAQAGEPTLESVSSERDAAQQQAQEYLALAQRAQADFQNFRRRAEQERAEAFDRGRGEVLLQMLPVLDDFERAMEALPAERRDEDWVQGLALIERKLRAALEGTGVERIAAEGQPFDPWEHEAVLHEARGDVAAGTVAAVARPGYRLGGRVLRPAQVVVAKEP